MQMSIWHIYLARCGETRSTLAVRLHVLLNAVGLAVTCVVWSLVLVQKLFFACFLVGLVLKRFSILYAVRRTAAGNWKLIWRTFFEKVEGRHHPTLKCPDCERQTGK